MSDRIKSYKEYKLEYKKSVLDPESFWGNKAKSFSWKKKWNHVLRWDFRKPEIKWFEGGKLNITENCLERHLKKRGGQTAIKWIANNPS